MPNIVCYYKHTTVNIIPKHGKSLQFSKFTELILPSEISVSITITDLQTSGVNALTPINPLIREFMQIYDSENQKSNIPDVLYNALKTITDYQAGIKCGFIIYRNFIMITRRMLTHVK